MLCAVKDCKLQADSHGSYCPFHTETAPKVRVARQEFNVGTKPEIDIAVAGPNPSYVDQDKQDTILVGFMPSESERFVNFKGQADRRKNHAEMTNAQKYPKYFKDVSDITELDVYRVHQLFNVQDASGALQHASKKILLSGVRTGGKNFYKDVQEARDALNRWLEMNDHRKSE